MENSYTRVPSKIIDEYLLDAKPEYIIVCLCALRRLEGKNGEISLKELAKALSMDIDTVSDALAYWKERGFLMEKARLDILPTYSAPEIQKMSEESDEIRYMFKMAERLYGKALKYSDMNLLVSFYDRSGLGLPVSVIEVLLDYCCSEKKRNNRYLESVAIDWANNDITTVELAEEYIMTFNSEHRDIKKAMGIRRRDLATEELAYIRKWRKELKLPHELILKACGKAVIQTGETNFKYADAILTNWRKEGITTVEEALICEQEFLENKAADISKKESTRTRSASRQKSRFASSNKRNWDYEELMRLAADYADKEAANTGG